MATATQIETWISEAEAARHKLMSGEDVVDVWKDGRRMRFQKASLSELTEYLAVLRSELVQAQIDEGLTVTRRRRAIGLAWKG